MWPTYILPTNKSLPPVRSKVLPMKSSHCHRGPHLLRVISNMLPRRPLSYTLYEVRELQAPKLTLRVISTSQSVYSKAKHHPIFNYSNYHINIYMIPRSIGQGYQKSQQFYCLANLTCERLYLMVVCTAP